MATVAAMTTETTKATMGKQVSFWIALVTLILSLLMFGGLVQISYSQAQFYAEVRQAQLRVLLRQSWNEFFDANPGVNVPDNFTPFRRLSQDAKVVAKAVEQEAKKSER